jgi:non-ribosomal peptide synthetase component F
MKKRIEAQMQYNDASLFMIIMAGISAVLYRFSGQQDMVLGVPYSNRPHSDLENQVGFYVNMLPLRLRFQAGTSFRNLLAQTKQTVLKAYDHGSYSFDQIVEDLNVQTDPGRTPLFDVMVQMQHSNTLTPGWLRNDFTVSPVELDRGVSKYDLLFNIVESNDAINIDIEYNTDLFKDATVTQMRDTIMEVFSIVTDQPDITMTELRKKLMGASDDHHLNYSHQITADIEQNF